jgi:hypothetical protein
LDEKQQNIRQNKQMFKPNEAKYIVFTNIGRARERHRGYGSNNLWMDQSGTVFNPVWPEPLNDGSGYEIVAISTITTDSILDAGTPNRFTFPLKCL